MKYEAIRRYSSEYSVRKMCIILGLRQSGYYQWLSRREKRQEKCSLEGQLAAQIGEVFKENKSVYGYRKMQRALSKAGLQMSTYLVRKVMRENGYYPVVVKKYKPTHNGKSDGKYLEDKVKQEFRPEKLNEIWAGDITYIKTKLGFVYLAAVLDLCNREVIGYQIGKQIDTELVKAALGNAIGRAGGNVEQVIFHSDRGCQYSSKAYQSFLSEHKMIGSMSRPACPYDNSCLESFFSTAKRECIYRKDYDTINEVKQDLFEYIELFYNRKRMHESLGYLTPAEYRLQKEAA
jgi:Transposase and inactivated derivatives